MNQNSVNYQRELEKIIASNKEMGRVPSLLLHSCCAPCSTYCLEYLSEFFKVTVLYYNPNISPKEEYEKRVREQEYLIGRMNQRGAYPVSFQAGPYEPESFYQAVKGLEKVPEGGQRCYECFRLRLLMSALYAKEGGYDYFTTTLTISPLKDARVLNEIGLSIAREHKLTYLVSDFKKKNGYKRSTELSREYGLYRQNYCGCIYSKMEQMERGQKP